MPLPPKTKSQLLARVDQIAGCTVGELAYALRIPIPQNIQAAKGFAGIIAELALGASAGSNPIQDFPEIGVELKTIPLNEDAQPTETTHVCVLNPKSIRGATFEESNVYNKLSCVLWLPIEGNTQIPLVKRKFGQGFLWQMDNTEYQQIKTDWEEIMHALTIVDEHEISASIGEFLQIRPAGYRQGIKQYGFYLRKNFTNNIIQNFLQGKLEKYRN